MQYYVSPTPIIYCLTHYVRYSVVFYHPIHHRYHGIWDIPIHYITNSIVLYFVIQYIPDTTVSCTAGNLVYCYRESPYLKASEIQYPAPLHSSRAHSPPPTRARTFVPFYFCFPRYYAVKYILSMRKGLLVARQGISESGVYA